MLLGDMMGTKALLLGGEFLALQETYSTLTRCFADCYTRYHKRSRSLFCLAFSDSIIAIWGDFNEGRRFCHLFARDLHNLFQQSGIIARIFVDKGDIVSSIDSRFELYSALESRFISFSPVSIGAWSVFHGESAHFAPGVYFGAELAKEVRAVEGIAFSTVSCLVGKFSYKRMISDAS
jgi:hypothetical protein